MALQSRNIYASGNPLLDRYLAQIAQRLDTLEGLRPDLSAGFMKLTSSKTLTTESLGAIAYIGNSIDSTVKDHGVTTSDSSRSIKDWITEIGTSKKATLVFRHLGAGSTTSYLLDSSVDLSSHPNIYLYIEPGAIFNRVTGDEVLTIYSPENLIVGKRQQITSVDMISFANGGTVYPAWWGAVGNGTTDDASPMQYALTAAQNGRLFVPNGSYLIDSDTLEIKSNTVFEGESWKAILVGSYNPSAHNEYYTETGANIRMILANDDMSSGNSNFIIKNLYFDFTAATDGQSVCMHFRNCSDYQVINCKTEDSGDGISQTYASDFLIQGNICLNHLNAAIDMWGQSKNGKIVENTIRGNGTTSTYGILVTGADTDYSPSGLITENIQIIGNKIYNMTDLGIWLQGAGSGSGDTNYCYDCMVIGNLIDTVVEYHGIKATSGGRHIISGNIIKDIYMRGIAFATELSGDVAAPQNCVITNNIFYNVSTAGSGSYSAIVIGDANGNSDGNLIQGNIILGSNHKYGVEEGNASNAYNIIKDNYIAAGVTGNVIFDGTTNYVQEVMNGSMSTFFQNTMAIRWRNAANSAWIHGMSLNSGNDLVIGQNTAGYGLNIQNQALNFANLSTSTSAVAGTNGDVPAQVVGYLNVKIGGTNYRIPYYDD